MLTIKNYVKVQSLEEAWQLNQKKKNRIIGGMLWLKMGKRTIQTAIDLSDLGLNTIEENEEEFSIGCMTTLRQIETHEGLAAYTDGAIRESVCHIVGVQFRNLATVGGSIAGRFGFSDVLTMFLAMDSYVELYKGGIVPMKEFAAAGCGDDILVRVIVKKTPMKLHYGFVRNAKTDFPILTCAASKTGEGSWRFAVGARPARAVVITDTENLLSGEITEEKANCFGEYAADKVPTGSNMRGSAAYRSHLVKVLISRAVKKLGGVQHAD